MGRQRYGSAAGSRVGRQEGLLLLTHTYDDAAPRVTRPGDGGPVPVIHHLLGALADVTRGDDQGDLPATTGTPARCERLGRG
ncbi:hypothetical protein [Streptomyces sp. NPDC058092]|uniref:hypothetical protein n=1 Tax=Streptomyces sp. NPDC058092 TaxID=3346336 RepID=UPI0036DFFDE2